MGNKPDFKAVTKIGDKLWRQVGAAWAKDEGKVSLSLDFMPLPTNGKVSILLVPQAEDTT